MSVVKTSKFFTDYNSGLLPINGQMTEWRLPILWSAFTDKLKTVNRLALARQLVCFCQWNYNAIMVLQLLCLSRSYSRHSAIIAMNGGPMLTLHTVGGARWNGDIGCHFCQLLESIQSCCVFSYHCSVSDHYGPLLTPLWLLSALTWLHGRYLTSFSTEYLLYTTVF